MARIVELAKSGAYDDVVFHHVIEGFMAQTGDVQFGKRTGDITSAGMGGVGAAGPEGRVFRHLVPARHRGDGAVERSGQRQQPQFFIMFAPASHLDGGYTVVGHVIEGLEVVDALKKGDPAANGLVSDPDYMVNVTVAE